MVMVVFFVGPPTLLLGLKSNSLFLRATSIGGVLVAGEGIVGIGRP
jgi:hypothetical protein